MLARFTRILLALRSVLEARASREAEIRVLRQQLLVLTRRRPHVRLRNLNCLILVWLCRLFRRVDTMVIVKPEDRAALASARLSGGLALEVLARRRQAQSRL